MSRTSRLVFACLAVLFVAVALAPERPGLPPNFKSDEPAYYLMSRSLVEDGDLLCEPRDLQRLWDEFLAPAHNLIMMTDDDWRTVYFGKAFAYSLFAAPAVAVAGANGMVAFNMALLMSMIWMAASYLAKYNGESLSLLFAFGFFVLSHSFSYVFWLHPEVFVAWALTVCLYFGLDEVLPVTGGGLLARVTSGSWRLGWSGAALALAVYNKPMYGAIGIPVVVGLLLQKRVRALFVWGAGAGLMMAGLCGIAMLLTGHPSAYLGVTRQGLQVHTPYEIPHLPGWKPPADPVATPTTVAKKPTKDENLGSWDRTLSQAPPFRAQNLEDLGYLLWGRHTGILLYTPFTSLALLLFAAHSWRSLRRWALLASMALIGAFLLVYIWFNWHGGGGFIGNRYWVSVYPGFLFLITRLTPAWLTAVGFAAGGILTGSLFLTPYGPVVPNPTLQAHTRNAPYPRFPVERTVQAWIPGYQGNLHGKLWVEARNDAGRPHGDELWLLGATEVELMITSIEPLGRSRFEVRNIAPGNVIELDFEGARARLVFGDVAAAGEVRTVELLPRRPQRSYRVEAPKFPYPLIDQNRYRLRVRSTRGANPNWLGAAGRDDFYLGAGLLYLGDAAELERDVYHVDWRKLSAPKVVTIGCQFQALTTVVNRSEFPWLAGGATRVNLSYHWLDSTGAMVVREGLRTGFPKDVAPGEAQRLPLEVEAPLTPGRYTLVVDVVRERLSWFAPKTGGKTVAIEIDVIELMPSMGPVAPVTVD